MTDTASQSARKVCREHGIYPHNPQRYEGCAFVQEVCESLVEAGLLGTATSQIESTLALVEQQRIANLIALAKYENENGAREYQHVLNHLVDEFGTELNEEIKEALGL